VLSAAGCASPLDTGSPACTAYINTVMTSYTTNQPTCTFRQDLPQPSDTTSTQNPLSLHHLLEGNLTSQILFVRQI